MIGVNKISHATYESPDLEHQLEYYTDILGLTLTGRERDAAYLASTIEHHSVVLRSGSHPRCTRIGFQLGPDADLDAFEKQTAAHGIRTERKKDPEPTITDMVSFEDIKGTVMEVFKQPEPQHQPFSTKGIVPHKLGHIAFHVTDAQRATRFYCDVLGFKVSDWMGDFFSFLRCGPDHHTINLVETGKNKHFHTAFELRDWAPYADRARSHQQARLQDAVGPGPSRHRPQSVFLSPQPERPDHRVVRRTRPDEGRVARLFRAASLASRQSAASEDLAEDA